MPISDWNFREKDSVTSCAPTNSLTPIQTLGQPLIFGFGTIRTIGTCIQLVSTKSTIFFQRSEKVAQLRTYVVLVPTQVGIALNHVSAFRDFLFVRKKQLLRHFVLG